MDRIHEPLDSTVARHDLKKNYACQSVDCFCGPHSREILRCCSHVECDNVFDPKHDSHTTKQINHIDEFFHHSYIPVIR